MKELTDRRPPSTVKRVYSATSEEDVLELQSMLDRGLIVIGRFGEHPDRLFLQPIQLTSIPKDSYSRIRFFGDEGWEQGIVFGLTQVRLVKTYDVTSEELR